MSDLFERDEHHDFFEPPQTQTYGQQGAALFKSWNEKARQRREFQAQIQSGIGAGLSMREFSFLYDMREKEIIDDDQIYKIISVKELSEYSGIDASIIYDNYDAIWQAISKDIDNRYASPMDRAQAITNSIKIAENLNPMGLMGLQLQTLHNRLYTANENEKEELQKQADDLWKKITALRDENERLSRGMPKDALTTIITATIQSAPLTGKSFAAGAAGAVVAGGVGALVGGGAGFAAGAGIGYRLASGAASGLEMAGLMYIDLLAAGVKQENAAGLALLGGSVQGIIESSLGVVAGWGRSGIKAVGGAVLSKEVREKIAEAASKNFISKISHNVMASPVGRSVFTRTAASTARQAGEEGLEELLQFLVDQAMLSWADAMQDAPVERDSWFSPEFNSEMWNSIVGGFAGGLGFGIVGLPLNIAGNIKQTAKEVTELKDLAIAIDNEDEFIAAADKNPLTKNFTRENYKEVYASQAPERQAYHQEMREKAARAGHRTAALPTLEAPGEMRRKSDGRLDTVITYPEASEGSGTGTITLFDAELKKHQMGSISFDYDVDTNTITIEDVNISQAITNREAVIGDMIKELSFDNQLMKINLEATEEMSKAAGVDMAAIKANLQKAAIETNPLGDENGLQFFNEGDKFGVTKQMADDIRFIAKVRNAAYSSARNDYEVMDTAFRKFGLDTHMMIEKMGLTSEEDLRVKAGQNPMGVEAQIADGIDNQRLAAQMNEQIDGTEKVGGAFIAIKRGENGSPDRILYRNAAMKLAMDMVQGITVITKDSNAATLLHEWLHFMVSVVIPNSPRYKRMLEDAVSKHFGKGERIALENFTEEHHEWIADNWEKFLQTGEAPTSGLKALFIRIKEALKNLLLNMDLNQDLRNFFDELLAGPDGDMLTGDLAQNKTGETKSRVRIQTDNERQQTFAEMTEAERILQSDLHSAEEKEMMRFAMIKNLASDVSEEPEKTRNIPSKAWPENFPAVTHFIDAENKLEKPWKELTAHPDYDQAKNHENTESAERLVRDFLKSERQQRQIRELTEKYPDAIVVPVHAVEEHSRNKIPSVLAEYISRATKLEVDEKIVQTNKVHRTGKENWYRFAFRSKFDGDVKQGRKYILVDDVFSNGGAFSELRRYIELNGGEVAAMAAMATGGHGENIALTEKTRLDLESKFGVESLKQFLQEEGLYGGNYQSLTEPEGYTLLRTETLDEARDRISEARQAGSTRVLQDSVQGHRRDSGSQEINSPDTDKILFQVIEHTEEEKELISAAKEVYGTTNDFREAGYLLTDGSVLDFSDKKNGARAKRRNLDHREMNHFKHEGKEYKPGMLGFMQIGNIRLSPECGGIQLTQIPTAEQLIILRKYIKHFNGDVIVDFADKENLDISADVEYTSENTDRILNDIKNYYEKGIIPEQKPMLFQTAYHGSPYRFERFDSTHMGSGEGAQVYGWGHYFSGKKEVAQWYHEELANSYVEISELNETEQQNLLALFNEIGFADYILDAPNKILDIDTLEKFINDTGNGLFDNLKGWLGSESKVQELAVKYELKSILPGQLYEVDIPGDDEMLDWDKPLKEQAPAIKDSLKHFLQDNQAEGILDMGENTKGQWIYEGSVRVVSNNLDISLNEAAKYTSQKLNEYGIKGIRYLDGTSRGKGKGSHNYVIFDDNEINITQMFFQMTREDIHASALRHTSWQKWMDADSFAECFDEQAAYRMDDSTEEPHGKKEIEAWYEKQWNEAQVLAREAALKEPEGIRTPANAEAVDPELLESDSWLDEDKEYDISWDPELYENETDEKNVTENIDSVSGNEEKDNTPITTSEANGRLIQKLPHVIDDFLTIIGQTMRTNLAHFGAITEEDAAVRDQMEQDKKRIYTEVHPYICGIALRMTTNKKINDTQRKTVMSHMLRSLESGAAVYRELYTTLTEDPEFVNYAKNEIADKGAKGEAQRVAAEAKGLTAFQRTRLAEKIINKDLAKRIRAGIASSEEVEDYLELNDKEFKELEDEIKSKGKELEQSQGETAAERAEAESWRNSYYELMKKLRAAKKEAEQLEKKLERTKQTGANAVDRTKAGSEKSEAKLKTRLAEKQEEIRELRRQMKKEKAHALKQGKLEIAWKWAEAKQKLDKKEKEKKRRIADRKAAMRYFDANKKLTAYIMSSDRIGMNIFVRQRELILALQNLLYGASKETSEALQLDAEIKDIKKKLEKAKKQHEKAADEDTKNDAKSKVEKLEQTLSSLKNALYANPEAAKALQLGSYIKKINKKIETAKQRLAKANDKTVIENAKSKIEKLEKHLEDIQSERQKIKLISLELAEMRIAEAWEGSDTIDSGVIVFNGEVISVEQLRKDFFEKKIRFGFMDSKARKALRGSAPSAKSLGEKRKWSAGVLARSFSQEDLLAIKAVIEQLNKEGKANWERRQFAVRFHQQEQIKLLLFQQDELKDEEKKTGAVKRWLKARDAKSDEESEKQLAKGGELRQTIFSSFDDKRLVQHMDGDRKRALHKFIIRDRYLYASRRDVAIMKRTGRILDILGQGTAEEQEAEKNLSEKQQQKKRHNRAEKFMKELKETKITIEGISRRKAVRKWEYDTSFNLQEAEATFIPSRTKDLSLAELMFLSVALKNKFSYEHYIYGNLWSKDEQAYYERFMKDGKMPAAVMAQIKDIGDQKAKKIWEAIKQHIEPREDLKQIIKAIRDDFEAHFHETRSTFEDMFNQVVEGQDNYLPIIINEERHASAEKQDEIEALTMGSHQVKISPNDGMNHVRVNIGPTHQTAIETDIFKVYFQGVEREEHFNKFAPYVRDLNTVLRGRNNNSKQLASHLKDMYGKWAVYRMYKHINTIGLPPSAKLNNEMQNASNLGRALAGNAGVAYIAYNIPAWLAQYPNSIAAFFGKADTGLIFASLLEVMKPGSDLVDKVYEKSPMVKQRIISVADEFRRHIKEQPGKLKEAHSKFIELGMWGQRHADRTMVCAGWWALYQTALKDGKSEEDAVVFADEITAETQPDTHALETSPLFKDEGLGKLFLRFGLPLNVVWQNMTYDNLISRERSMGSFIARVTAYGMAALIVAAMRGALAKKDDEEKDNGELIRKVFFYMMFAQVTESVPLLGSGASATVEYLITGDAVFYSQRNFELAQRVMNTFVKLKKENLEGAFTDAFHALSLTVGLPISQINRNFKAIQNEDPWIIFGYNPD